MPLETHFQFTSSNFILTDIRIVTSDAFDALQLTTLLDEQFDRFENVEEFAFAIDYLGMPFANAKLSSQLPPNDVASVDRLYWRSDVGHAFILEQDTSEATLYLTGFRSNTSFEFDSAEEWKETLNDLELRAWARVEAMLHKANLLDQVQSVVFVDDGYGGEALSITTSIKGTFDNPPRVLAHSLVLYIDAHDSANPQGTLYYDEELLSSFLRAWTSFKFTAPTQVELAATTDESGQVVSITRGQYLPTAYLSRYMDSFGEKWLSAYTAQEAQKETIIPDNIREELSSRIENDPMHLIDFMVPDLSDAFIFYISGTHSDTEATSFLKQSFAEFYGDDYSEVINEFFSQFPEAVEAKEAFAEYSH